MDHSKTFRNMIFVFVLGIFSALFGYLLRIFLTRNYPVAEYGLFNSVIAFFSIFLMFIDLGLSQAVVKKVSELRAKKDVSSIKNLFFTVLVTQLIYSAILALIFFALSHQINDALFKFRITLYFNMMILWFFTMPLQFFIVTYYLSHEKTTLYAFFEFLKIAFIFIGTYILTMFHFGIISVFFCYAMLNFFIFGLFILYNYKIFIPFNMKYKIGLLFPETVKYGLYVSIGIFAWAIIAYTDTLVITLLKGLHDTGVYQAAFPLAASLGIVVNPILSVLFSSSANLWAQKKKKELSDLFVKIYKYILILVMPFTLMLSIFSELIIKIIFGQEYIGAATSLSLLAFGFMFMNLSYINSYILSSMGLAKKSVKLIIYAAIINLILNLVLVYYIGIAGAALASMLTFIMLFIRINKLTSKYLKIKFPVRHWINIALCNLFFIIPIFILKALLKINYVLVIVISLAVASLLYLAALYVFKVISFKELDFLKGILTKRFAKKQAGK